MVAASPPPDPARRVDLFMTALVRAWVRGVERRPRLALGLTLGLMLLSGWAIATHLSIRTDTSAMLSPDLPFQQDHARLKAAFPDLGDDLVVVIDGLTPAVAERAAQTLSQALTQRPDVIARAVDLAGLPFFRRNGLLYLSPAALDTLAGTLTQAQPFLAGLGRDPSLRGLADLMDLALGHTEAPSDPILIAVLERMTAVTTATQHNEMALMDWSAAFGTSPARGTATRRFLLIKPVLNNASLSPAGAAMAAVRAAAAEAGLSEATGVRVRLTGSAALAQEELGTVRSSMGVSNLVSFGIVALLLVWGLRSGRLILATNAALVAGLVITAGFAAVTVGTLNLISVAFAVLFIGLSVDFGLHYGLRYREARVAGLANAAALDEAASSTGTSLVLSALAAMLAFLSFLPTDYLGLAQLGLISGAGMAIALLLNLTLLPAILTLMPARPVKPIGVPAGALRFSLLHLPERRPRATLAMTSVLVGGALWLAVQIRFDVDPLALKDPATESLSTLYDVMKEPGLDPYSIDILAADAAEAARLTEALNQLEAVRSVASLPALVPAEQDQKLQVIEDLAFTVGPSLSLPQEAPPDAAGLVEARRRLIARLADVHAGTAAPAAQALATALGALGDDPTGLERLQARLLDGLPDQIARLRDSLSAGPVSLADIPPDLRARYGAADGQMRLQVFPRDDLRDPRALQAFVAAVRPVAPHATGAPVIIVEAGRTVIGAFAEAAALATVLITAMLAAVMRRRRDILLVFVPVLLSGLFTLGSAVLIGQALNLANVIVLPLLVGLGVAGAIHVIGRAHETAGAVLDSSTPRAVVFSALTTVASFSSLILSDHPGTASMGILLTLALTLGLVCTLGILPAILALLRR
ncbi:MMPL family transporter [Pararhodospirillum photometricum]|nr:MMPL family transporter [Pararhodospirillum photometricum]